MLKVIGKVHLEISMTFGVYKWREDEIVVYMKFSVSLFWVNKEVMVGEFLIYCLNLSGVEV